MITVEKVNSVVYRLFSFFRFLNLKTRTKNQVVLSSKNMCIRSAICYV